jgi:hypothetical protein
MLMQLTKWGIALTSPNRSQRKDLELLLMVGVYFCIVLVSSMESQHFPSIYTEQTNTLCQQSEPIRLQPHQPLQGSDSHSIHMPAPNALFPEEIISSYLLCFFSSINQSIATHYHLQHGIVARYHLAAHVTSSSRLHAR